MLRAGAFKLARKLAPTLERIGANAGLPLYAGLMIGDSESQA